MFSSINLLLSALKIPSKKRWTWNLNEICAFLIAFNMYGFIRWDVFVRVNVLSKNAALLYCSIFTGVVVGVFPTAAHVECFENPQTEPHTVENNIIMDAGWEAWFECYCFYFERCVWVYMRWSAGGCLDMLLT